MRDHDERGGPTSETASPVDVATAFARVMDAGDLASLARLMAPGCECRDGATRVLGPEAIVALHRALLRWLEQGFDEVRRESRVEHAVASEATVGVTTTLMRVPGHWHRLRHSCTLAFEAGRIKGIVNGCEAGAASAFRAFVEDCGAPPPPPGFGV